MPPSLALFLWLVLLLSLLRWDPVRVPKSSWALWISIVWLFILASRLPSQWLGTDSGGSIEEGNPVDRAIFFVIIVAAIAVLASRSFNWSNFVSRNLALSAFVAFALLSVVWSDYPFVTFKRWFRDLGNYLIVLIALSDQRPKEAVSTVLRRFAYLMIPLSILLNKYFPQLSKQYDFFTGAATYAGATTSKNMLGVVCLICGMFFFWDTLARWSKRRERQNRRVILLNAIFFLMTIQLLWVSNSATSKLCLALGCIVIYGTQSNIFKRHPKFLRAVVPTIFVLYVVLAVGFNINAEVAQAMGRDPTLTDRTKIWAILLNMHTEPLLGTGYETFWLGHRVDIVWASFPGLNEAHNGYLEIYLNLGIIGLALLLTFLAASYRNIGKELKASLSLGSLWFALWTIMLFYNITEAAFRGQIIWVIFLFGGMVVPATIKVRRSVMAPVHKSEPSTSKVHPSKFEEDGIERSAGFGTVRTRQRQFRSSSIGDLYE